MQDYHIHTYYCEHAEGKIEEYIERAIYLGLVDMAFSDHSPLPYPKRKGIAMDISNLSEYKREIRFLQEKYKEKINIKLALEVDFPLWYPIDNLKTEDFDFLIGSVHYIEKWGFDNPEEIENYKHWNVQVLNEKYYNTLLNMIKSGYFQVVGHLDLIKKFAIFPKIYPDNSLIKEIIFYIKKNKMAVELNTSGFRKPIKEAYPDNFWLEKLYNNDIPIVISSDAHSPDEVGYKIKWATSILKKIGYRKIAVFFNKKMNFISL